VRSDAEARHTHFMVGGKVRQTIKDIGGEMPENLQPEKHIKQIKKEVKRSIKAGSSVKSKNLPT
jgi:DNA-damage-inducible protein D